MGRAPKTAAYQNVASVRGDGRLGPQNSPPGSLTVGLVRLAFDALRSSLVIFQLMPSTGRKQDLGSAGELSFSPSQVSQPSLPRKPGMRSDSACSVESVRMSALAGTVTMTQAISGAGRSGISKRSKSMAMAPAGSPPSGMVYCSVTLGDICFPSLKVLTKTIPRWAFWKARAKVGLLSIVSDRAWIGSGDRQLPRRGYPQRIGTVRRVFASAPQMMRLTGAMPRKPIS